MLNLVSSDGKAGFLLVAVAVEDAVSEVVEEDEPVQGAAATGR